MLIKRFRRVAGATAALLCALAWHAPVPAQALDVGGAYLQYRTYENNPSVNDGFRAWIDFTSGGSLIGDGDVVGVQLYDPSDNVVAPQSLAFMRAEFVVATADPWGNFSHWSPYGYSGFLLDLRNGTDLVPGPYRFEAQASDGTSIVKAIEFPGKAPLTPVSDSSMGYEWRDGSLALWWGPPGDAFDEYRIVITGSIDREIFVGKVDPGLQSVTLSPQVVAAITPLVDPTNLPRWRVQTRRVTSDGMNYARSYSRGVQILDWPAPPPPPPPPPPPNDAFAGATVISGVPFSESLDVSAATVDWAEDQWFCYEPKATVWYAITLDQDLVVTLSTEGSTYTPTLTVLQGVPGWFTQVACGSPGVEFLAKAGQTYYLMVGAEYGSTPDRLVLSVGGYPPPPPPPNDAFADATIIPGLPFTDDLDVSWATADSNEDPWFCYVPKATVWYVLTPDRDLVVTVSTQNSAYTPTVTVLQGAAGSFDLVACGTSVFFARAGETYYLMVGADPWAPPGRLVLAVDGHPPFDVAVSVDPTGSFNPRTGAASVSGTVTCSSPAQAYVTVSLRQKVGRSIVEGSFFLNTPCDGETSWSAVVQSPIWAFAGGQASAVVFANAWTPYESDSAQVSGVIRLNGAAKGKK